VGDLYKVHGSSNGGLRDNKVLGDGSQENTQKGRIKENTQKGRVLLLGCCS
jgi:hypothetical protein